MKTIVKTCLWSLFILLTTATSVAQPENFEFGVDFLGAFPKGDLDETISDDGLGIGFYAAYRPKFAPFQVGGDFGFINYGSTSYKGPFRDCCRDLEEVETKNNIATGHLFFKLTPNAGAIRPYFEGLVGVKYFFTNTTFREDDEFDNDTDREFDDSAISYGAGTGFSLVLRDGRNIDGSTILLNVGIRYLFGGETEYVVEESVEIDGTLVTFDTLQSETDMLTARVGVGVRF